MTANTSTGPKHVFLVGDDLPAMNLYRNGLKQAGFRTVAAVPAQQGPKALARVAADLIILDLMSPKPGGFEFLKAIRADSSHRETPVLVLVNASLPEWAQEALRLGGNKALPKSECTVAHLISVARELVGLDEPRAQGPVDAVQGPDGAGSAELLEEDGRRAQQPRPAPPPNQPRWLQSVVKEKLSNLRRTLAEEAKRREAVEQQAAENAKRRSVLEAAIEENQRSQQWFQQLLEQSQRQALAPGEVGKTGHLNLAGRTRALVEVQRFVADKLVRLKEALVEETKRRETVEQEIAENAQRRAELETALGEIQRVQDAFQQEAAKADNPKRVLELESALAEHAQYRGELEAALVENEQAERTLQRELEASESAKRRGTLEAELAENKQTQAQLRHELEEAQQQQQSQQASSRAKQTRLEARTQELQLSKVIVELEVKRLTETLTAETERREHAQQQVDQIDSQRHAMERQLGQLRQELEASQGQLQAQ